MSNKAYDQPTRTEAVDGEVVLDGPDGVGLSMTPDAAEETARRLVESVREARDQKRWPRRSGSKPKPTQN